MDIDLPPSSLPLILSPTSLHESSATPIPVKRPRSQDDPFFLEGTYEYKAAWSRLHSVEAYSSHLDDFSFLQRCHQGSCHGQYTFHSMTAYEHHYETNHRFICQTCKKPFPSQKFLDIHLSEVHDLLVRIRKERGEKTYQCFVEDCERVCSSSTKRRMHMIDKHKYPKWFNFDIVFSGVLPLSQRIKDAKQRQLLKASRDPILPQQSTSMDMDISQESMNQKEGHLLPESREIGYVARFSGHHRTGNIFRARPRPEFVQYGQPNTTQTPSVDDIAESQSSGTSTHSSMNVPDVDMEGLQQCMARLMVPRSVALKAAKK